MAPFPSKELVKTGVHWANGSATFPLSSNTNGSFGRPLVAIIVSVCPLTAMLVILGVMSRTWKRLICALGLDPVEEGVRIKV